MSYQTNSTNCNNFLNNPANNIQCPPPKNTEYACTKEYCGLVSAVSENAAKNCKPFVDHVNSNPNDICGRFSCTQMIKNSCDSHDYKQAQQDANKLTCYCPK